MEMINYYWQLSPLEKNHRQFLLLSHWLLPYWIGLHTRICIGLLHQPSPSHPNLAQLVQWHNVGSL
jgi:hypothetical protein